MLFNKKFTPLAKSAIKADQPLLFPVYNRQGTLLAEKGVILNNAQIETLMSNIAVYTLNRAFESAQPKNKKHHDAEELVRLPPPFQRLISIEENLLSVYEKPTSNSALSKILTLINRLQSVCEKSPNAVIAKIITDSNENYAVRHAVHTAILCELTARHLNWPAEEKRNLIGAALTMNLSLRFLQNDLLDQSQPLSLDQQQTIHNHPTKSANMLRDMGMKNAQWLEFVEKHHEAIDGSGYPIGWQGDHIPLGALLINLSDIYCAKVSGRNYRKPVYANVATRDIFLEKDNTEKGTLIEIFVKILGLYPPGCLVKLKSLELGIVIQRGDRIDTPKVKILSEKNCDPLILKTIRQTNDKNYAVQETAPRKSIGGHIDYDKIWPY